MWIVRRRERQVKGENDRQDRLRQGRGGEGGKGDKWNGYVDGESHYSVQGGTEVDQEGGRDKAGGARSSRHKDTT